MRPQRMVFGIATVPFSRGSLLGAQSAPAARPHLIVVRMVERLPYGIAFDPIRVRVQRGDTVRFVQSGGMPHYVEFRSVPKAVDLGPTRAGPLLVSLGQIYDILHSTRGARDGGDHLCRGGFFGSRIEPVDFACEWSEIAPYLEATVSPESSRPTWPES